MHSKIMLYQPIITEYITDFSNLVVRTPYIRIPQNTNIYSYASKIAAKQLPKR